MEKREKKGQKKMYSFVHKVLHQIFTSGLIYFFIHVVCCEYIIVVVLLHYVFPIKNHQNLCISSVCVCAVKLHQMRNN